MYLIMRLIALKECYIELQQWKLDIMNHCNSNEVLGDSNPQCGEQNLPDPWSFVVIYRFSQGPSLYIKVAVCPV